MKAVFFYGARDIRLEETDEPTAGPGDVLIDVAWCGLCGTDLGEYLYGPIGIPVGTPHPLTGGKLPVVLGHELSGTVLDVGPGVEHVSAGDRVVVNPILRCESCRQCRIGLTNLCDRLGVVGLSGGSGGLSQRAVVPGYSVYVIPERLDLSVAPMVEPLAVAIHAVRRARVVASDEVTVMGAGPIGLIIAAYLRFRDVARLDVVEPSLFRRELAQIMGADNATPPEEGTHRRSVDVVFEASGSSAALDRALSTVRPGGRVVLLSRFKGQVATLDPNRFRAEIDLISSQAYLDEFPEAIELVASGRLPVERLITSRIGLDQVETHGLQLMADPGSRTGKIFVHVGAGV